MSTPLVRGRSKVQSFAAAPTYAHIFCVVGDIAVSHFVVSIRNEARTRHLDTVAIWSRCSPSVLSKLCNPLGRLLLRGELLDVPPSAIQLHHIRAMGYIEVGVGCYEPDAIVDANMHEQDIVR